MQIIGFIMFTDLSNTCSWFVPVKYEKDNVRSPIIMRGDAAA